MQLRNFDLNLLKSLDALLTERSVTRAAERVYLSQPAMSGALRRLRDEFRDQLLIRKGREMDLTPLAKSLAVSVRQMLDSIQLMLDTQLRFDPLTARRSFNFVMTDYAAMVIMPHVVDRLSRDAPFIRCNVQAVDEAVASHMLSGDVDLFIGIQGWLDQTEAKSSVTFCSEPLFADDFVCIIADDHPEIGDFMSMEQYCSMSHGLVRFPRQVESLVERQWHHSGLDLQVGLATANFATLVLMLPHTRLIATVQRRLAHTLARALPLRVVECPLAIPALEERLVWHPRAALDPAHDFIRSLLFDSANRVAAQGEMAAPIRTTDI